MVFLHLLRAGLTQDLIDDLCPDYFFLWVCFDKRQVLSLTEVVVPDGCLELTLGVVDGPIGLLIGRSGGLSDWLFADIEEAALFGNEESVVAVMSIGLDAYLVGQLLLHSNLHVFRRGFLGLAVNVVIFGLFRIGVTRSWRLGLIRDWLTDKREIVRRRCLLVDCRMVY